MSMSEKSDLALPVTAADLPAARPRRSRLPLIVLTSLLLFLVYHGNSFLSSSTKHHHHGHQSHHDHHKHNDHHKHHDHHEHHKSPSTLAKCPAQPSPLNVGSDWNPSSDPTYALLAAQRLSKSVQINTESFDDLPLDPTDPAFDKHNILHEYLSSEYPTLYTDPIQHEYINTHAHLFTWNGTNPDLRPILLMAHTDTVPVLPATLGQWRYPPFEGSITVNGTADTPGTWIWGRGSSDCKNSVMGIYNALERLVSEGYVPERTILVANGFDEEIGGPRGAASLAKVVEERYGADGVSLILDEGFSGISHEYGATLASLGMAEKGAINVKVKVETLGGHSSVPPTHTGIGIISLVLAELEANPFEPELDPEGPYLKYLSCLAEHAPELPKKLKKHIRDPKEWEELAVELAKGDRKLNSMLATSQAIDLIRGGVKINALPEVVEATVNYRISFTSSVNETIQHIQSVLNPLVKSLNFTLSSFDSAPKNSTSHITLSTPGETALEPAPITPSDSRAFELMAGTCKTVFGAETVVAPTGMFGAFPQTALSFALMLWGLGGLANTDTKWFWNVSKHLYRFTPAVVVENLNQHTVDERISLEGHLNTTRFFYKLLRNTEGWVGDE